MKTALQLLRSLLFITVMYLGMLIVAVAYFPLTLIDRAWAFSAIHRYIRFVRWAARVIVGLRSEIRGTPPEGEVIIASTRPVEKAVGMSPSSTCVGFAPSNSASRSVATL